MKKEVLTKIVHNHGIGVSKILLLAFLTLFILKVGQVGGFAEASWWVVALPLWGPPALLVGVFVTLIAVVLVLYVILWFADRVSQARKRKRDAKKAEKFNDDCHKRMTRPHLPGHPKNRGEE